MAIALSVVIPAYNESAAIDAGALEIVRAWLAARPFSTELIVADDGSADDTVARALLTADLVLELPRGGKASALSAGARAASGEIVLLSDMDLATPIEDGSRLLEAIRAGADAAIGSRGLVRPGAPPQRYLLSLGQMLLSRLLLGLPFSDTQCGFKAWRRSVLLQVLDQMVVYAPERPGGVRRAGVTSGFDVECLLVARRLGMDIREIPVSWKHMASARVRPAREAIRGVRDLLGIAAARRKNLYPPARPSSSARVRRLDVNREKAEILPLGE
ncbi:MAG: glycosyltransferase [marine benthic group bacterium]|jgi:glycosyltransferase involved in cell wall biosynthesis|nr:glycosyltransferase [Candidatus Carthagonibacter metallireducens]MCL7964279.1 glycosyltransferase [Gemmatimonadota bacterium]MCL7967507.1 glycosyltransferase [Gemmatimonadota bacterium]MCL7970054.1 glycosyltransferase [Gemmatimonadota bacterium]MCL7980026.1 glycosyltransferase [Gemmatimonadota bacterium]